MNTIAAARAALRAAADNVLTVEIPDGTTSRWQLGEAARALIFHCLGFLQLLERNARLRDAAERSRADYVERKGELRRRRIEFASDLLLLVKEVTQALPKRRRPRGELTFRKLRSEARNWEDLDAAERTQEVCDELQEMVREARGAGRLDAGVARAFQQRATSIHDRAKHLQQALRLAPGHPGAALEFLDEVDGWALPAPGSIQQGVDAHLPGHLPGYSGVLRFLDPDFSPKDKHEAVLRQMHTRIARDVRAIATDLDRRLGEREALSAVVARYAARTQRFDARDLRSRVLELMEVSTQQPELFLSRHAAGYLHDAGFESVTTEYPYGQQRFDHLAVLGEGALVVEAKVCRQGNSLLKVVSEGWRQVNDYCNKLAAERVQTDAVLLIFRLGGPLVPGTEHEYEVEQRRVRVFGIDISDPAQGGRNAPPASAWPAPEDVLKEIHRGLARPEPKRKVGTAKPRRTPLKGTTPTK